MAVDRLGRRDRFTRTPTGKRLSLNERDLDILHWLYRYRYLRQDQLVHILAPRSPKRLIERLGDLFHETGFINRPQLQAPLFDARATPMLYEVSTKGIRYLESLGALPHRAVTFSKRSRRSFSPQFLHTMMIIETLLGIELETRTEANRRLVPVDEILAKAPTETAASRNPLAIDVRHQGKSTKIIPDGLYGIEYEQSGIKGYRFWALECERTSPQNRSTRKHSSTAKKKELYAALLQDQIFKERWGIPNLDVSFVTKNGQMSTLQRTA
jgi:DNA-binding transcriptional MerR regulator